MVTEISAAKESKGLYERKKDMKGTKGDIYGGIFKVSEKCINSLSNEKSFMHFPGIKKSDVEEKCCDIRGIWFGDMYIDDVIANKDITAYPI